MARKITKGWMVPVWLVFRAPSSPALFLAVVMHKYVRVQGHSLAL